MKKNIILGGLLLLLFGIALADRYIIRAGDRMAAPGVTGIENMDDPTGARTIEIIDNSKLTPAEEFKLNTSESGRASNQDKMIDDASKSKPVPLPEV